MSEKQEQTSEQSSEDNVVTRQLEEFAVAKRDELMAVLKKIDPEATLKFGVNSANPNSQFDEFRDFNKSGGNFRQWEKNFAKAGNSSSTGM